MIHPAPNPAYADFVNPPRGFELVKYSYFSRKDLVVSATSTADVSFFGDQVGVNSATIRDTNMSKPNAISNPKRFLAQFLNFSIHSITAADLLLAATILDMTQILMQTVLQINLLDKEYLTVPTWTVPAGGGMYGNSTYAVVSANNYVNGYPDKHNAYPIELPLEREATFTVTLRNVAAVTTTKPLKVECVLTGLLLRPNQ